MCSSATLAGFFDLSDASGPPWALLDLLLLFLDVLLLLVLLLVALHLADGRADLPLHALDAQLALVRQVVEVGVLLHRGQRRDLRAAQHRRLELGRLVAGQLDPTINTRAHVREIAPQADSATRTRRTRLTLDQTPAAFRLGSSVSVTVSSPTAEHFQLPLTALQEVDGHSRVWIIDSATQTVSPRDVSVLRRDARNVLLSGGIKTGDRVVSAGVYSLTPGQKVRLDKESSQ